MDRTAALIVAAGSGSRAGGGVPKQFAMLGAQSVLQRSVSAFDGIPVFVVVGEGQRAMYADAVHSPVADVFTGGAERQHSVHAGLEAMTSHGFDRVMIHDAARPFLSTAVVARLAEALDRHDGVVPVLPVADSLARADGLLGAAVDRSGVIRVQTPQAFRFRAILDAHRAWSGPVATDDAQVARAAGLSVATVAGDPMLDKITQPEDFARAEALLAARLISRSATGFDVHRLVPGCPLWLGGVLIPHGSGLSGHSDADVALHALTDALLGTIGAGDIGTHFPPSDAEWRGAASAQFVAHARDLIRAQGGRIDHVDITVICEAPRLSPYRGPMRSRIAEILEVPVTRVSVKATTTERLGLTGRGEGIAAQAIATVRLPEDL